MPIGDCIEHAPPPPKLVDVAWRFGATSKKKLAPIFNKFKYCELVGLSILTKV